MDTTALRQQLHEYIDAADDRKIEAMYTLLENSSDFKRVYSQEELDHFYQRREDYLNGSNPGMTMEESREYVKKSREQK